MATIFCFTSTGNSLYTAKQLAEKVGGEVRPMNAGPVRCDDDVIGFVVPVYFWGLPRMVERFLADLQIIRKDACVFAVVTSGGPGFGVLGRIGQLLRKKGVRLHYGTRIVSVSNYLPGYSPKDSAERRQAVDSRILEVADAVANRRANRVKAYTIVNKLAWSLYPNEGSDRHFTVAPSCTGCGTCRRVCPARNIAMKDGRPDFQHLCEHCLACVHQCPARAIDWKGKTRGKERYRNAGVSLDELIAFHSQHA